MPSHLDPVSQNITLFQILQLLTLIILNTTIHLLKQAIEHKQKHTVRRTFSVLPLSPLMSVFNFKAGASNLRCNKNVYNFYDLTTKTIVVELNCSMVL